jgi:hypothetical protein
MFHNIFTEMEEIIETLTFGLAKDFEVPSIIDDPHDTTPGYGFAMQEEKYRWAIMQHILDDPELRDIYFWIDGEEKHLNQGSNRTWLKQVARFKELFYLVIHFLCGMPKRGSEEWRLRVLNGLFRQRNIMYFFGRIGIIGGHSKTSASTGLDKPTLHFIPLPFERMFHIYYNFVAPHELYVVENIVNDYDPGYPCYFLSSNGKRWTQGHETNVLKAATKTMTSPPLGKAALRQILPGIAEHYCIEVNSSTVGNSILHSQMGHRNDTGQRLYARTADMHRHLTNEFCHDSLDFCKGWAELWGFDTQIPSLENALMRQKLFETQKGTWATTSQAVDIINRLEQLTALVKSLVPHGSDGGIENIYDAHDSIIHPPSLVISNASSLPGSTHSLKRTAESAFSDEENNSAMVSYTFVHEFNKIIKDLLFKMDVRADDNLEHHISAVSTTFLTAIPPLQAGDAELSTPQKSKTIVFSFRDHANKARKEKVRFTRKQEWHDNYYCTLCKVEMPTEEELEEHCKNLDDTKKAEHSKLKS